MKTCDFDGWVFIHYLLYCGVGAKLLAEHVLGTSVACVVEQSANVRRPVSDVMGLGTWRGAWLQVSALLVSPLTALPLALSPP